MYMIDSRIVPYLHALEANGVVSTSHITLRRCYDQHGWTLFGDLMAAHWETESIISKRRMYCGTHDTPEQANEAVLLKREELNATTRRVA